MKTMKPMMKTVILTAEFTFEVPAMVDVKNLYLELVDPIRIISFDYDRVATCELFETVGAREAGPKEVA